MFLKSIRLNNVKCFSDIFLSFENENGDIRKWTLLLAENGSGKSTLLKAIALATSGSDAITDLLGNPSDWVRYKTQACEIAAVLGTTEGKEREIRLQIAPEDTRPDVIKKNEQSLSWLDDALKKKKGDYFVLGFGASRHLNAANSRRTKTSEFTNKRAQRVATLFNPDATIKPIDAWAMDLDYIGNGTALETVRKVLSNLLPEIKFHRIDKQNGQLLFDTPDGIVPLHCLSDGYLAMAAWIGDLLFQVSEVSDDSQEKPLTAKGLLLIDESKSVEDMKNRYRHLRDKAGLSAKEQAELDKLTTAITELPLGGRASMILSEKHEQLLRKIEQELQEGRR